MYQCIAQSIMNLQQKLREQTYQLKNQITDLKNAFDLNRTILLMLSKQDYCNDPEHTPLLQIITRLTEVNNQIMLSSMDLIQERNALKQEIYKLNDLLTHTHEKLAAELQGRKVVTDASEYKLMMQEQLKHLNHELMAANEERIVQEQQVDYWKRKSENLEEWFKEQGEQLPPFQLHKPYPGKRKYESDPAFKYEIMNQQLKRENKKLRRYVDELESKLVLFVHSYSLQENPHKQQEYPFFVDKMSEIDMFKHALNDLRASKGSSQLFAADRQSVSAQIKEKGGLDQRRRSQSWPRHKLFKLEAEVVSTDLSMSNLEAVTTQGREERKMLQNSTDPFLVIQ